MHYLIKQFLSDRTQGKGRYQKLSINQARNKIRYFAPNDIEFVIDCSDAGTKGAPRVFSPVAKKLSISHKTHTLGDGKVCLATSINGWDLDQILIYCDSWAKGYMIYKRTGRFPDSPKDVFRTSINFNRSRQV